MASIVEAVKEWTVAHPELTKAIVIFVGVVGGAIGVVTALAGATAIMGAALGAAALPVLGIAAALGAVAVAAFGVTTERQRQELYAKHLGKSYSDLQKEIDANKEAMAKLTMEYQGGAITAEEYQQKLKELEEKNKELTTAQGITTMSLEEARAKIEEINNSKLSNQQKLQALQEIADKAFGAAKSVEQLKKELAFLQPTIDKLKKSKEKSRSGFGAQLALDFRDTFSWIP
nr:MAG TPA: Toxin B, 5D, E3, 7F VHH, TOXIN.87A [Caudoviricetes sp.]